jgi:hypothetical protein
VDIQEQGHHERNKAYEQKKVINKKSQVALNVKTRGGNGYRTFLHLKLLQNDFVFFEECWSMSEDNAI